MSHLTASVQRLHADRSGTIDGVSLEGIVGSAQTGDVLGVDQNGEASVVSPFGRIKAYAHGGNPTTTSNVSLYVPLTGSAYPYFLELGPLSINNTPRISAQAVSGFTWLYNTYSTGRTKYINAVSITQAGEYALSLDWCGGALTPSGAYIEVQWQTAAGVALGPRARLGRKDETMTPVVGRVTVTSSVVVGLYVHAVSGVRYNLDNFLDIFATVEEIK